MDTFVRLTKSPVVSIAKIRGCVRGASSEFVLACDMRFASRENTRLGKPEVGVGVHPGGGGTERLPQPGRPRTRARNHPRRGRLRRRHGGTIWICQPSATRRRTGRLRRRACAPDRLLRSACHRGGEEARQPGLAASADWLLDAIASFETTLTWPEAQQRIQALLKHGFQRDIDFEKRWPTLLGKLQT